MSLLSHLLRSAVCIFGHDCYGCVTVEALLLRFSICAYVCICMRMYMCVHVCVYSACAYVCICIYVCLCTCTHIHLYTRACGVHMHSYRRNLFICTVQSLYYMHVYYRCFLTPACVCLWGLEVGFVSACSWLVLVAGVGGYVLAGVEIGVLSCIFLYFCGC